MATIKEGKLLKRSPQSPLLFGGKKMQERFFILRADALLYYLPSDVEGIAAGRSGESSSRCKGMIMIDDVVGVYRASELPMESKGMQEMARSLMPSEVPATIFIPVDNGYGGVRIYELHDSDAAGAAIWVETLRAVVHLRGQPVEVVHQMIRACREAEAQRMPPALPTPSALPPASHLAHWAATSAQDAASALSTETFDALRALEMQNAAAAAALAHEPLVFRYTSKTRVEEALQLRKDMAAERARGSSGTGSCCDQRRQSTPLALPAAPTALHAAPPAALMPRRSPSEQAASEAGLPVDVVRQMQGQPVEVVRQMIRAYREAEAHGHVAPASPTPPALPPDSAARQAFEAALEADEAGDPIAALPKYIEAAEAYRDLAASGTALSESSAKWQRQARACIDRAEELKPLKERAEAERRRAEAERELSRREEALKQREQQLDSLAALSLASSGSGAGALQPPYWQACEDADYSADGFVLMPLDSARSTDAPSWATIEALLHTDQSSALGIGRDVVHKGHYTSLKLACAWRVQHPALWARFEIGRAQVRPPRRPTPHRCAHHGALLPTGAPRVSATRGAREGPRPDARWATCSHRGQDARAARRMRRRGA
jgi:hypothetical protein